MSENSSRIIEKDIFASSGIGPSESGDSEIIDLFGEAGRTSKLSCQAIYTVPPSPAAEDFNSGATASLVNQDLTYTALEAGAAGNDISIELINNGVPSQPLEVNVSGDAIAVTLEIGAGTDAELVNQGLTYTAVEPGVGGNDISIELIDNMTPGQPLVVDVTGDAIAVTLEYSDGVAASLTNQGLTYTAQNIGLGGNDISVSLLDLTIGQDLEVNVVGDAISVDLEISDGVPSSAVVQDITYTAINPGTYGDEITVTYINPGLADQPLDAYASFPEVYVSLATSSETYASLVVQDVLYEALEIGTIGNTIQFQYFGGGTAGSEGVLVTGGGLDPIVIQVALQVGVSTATNIMNAINGDPSASTLVIASISGNPLTTQTTYGPTAMAGGEDFELISTADEILAAVDAYQAGSPFVVLELTGTGSNVQTIVSVALSGGEDPVIVSTADDVKAAINADMAAAALIVVSGGGSDPLTGLGATNLSGGADPELISTADDVKAAVNADIDASALVVVTGAGTDPLVALAETNLAGGEASGVISTANDVKAAVNADILASALVEVTGAGADPLEALAETNLAGGVNGDVDVAESTFNIPAHDYVTGLEVQLSTTGILPAPLLVATSYYVIVIDANTIQLASSLENANNDIYIELSSAGAGVGTMTPEGATAASITFQMSNNGIVWADIQAPTSITATGTVVLSQPSAAYRYFKAVKTLTAGQVDLSALILVIGPAV